MQESGKGDEGYSCVESNEWKELWPVGMLEVGYVSNAFKLWLEFAPALNTWRCNR